MSQENVEWVRQLAAAWGAGDMDAVVALMEARVTTDYEYHPLYLDRVYRGVNATRKIAADISATWEDYRWQLEEIVDLGEYLLVLTRITARGAGSGVPIDQRLAMLFRFRGDKLAWGKSFESKAQALEAVGLRG